MEKLILILLISAIIGISAIIVSANHRAVECNKLASQEYWDYIRTAGRITANGQIDAPIESWDKAEIYRQYIINNCK